ncbi:MAG: hypothetical protein WBB45_20500 [Cyclobacteriaceae bacterium]
MTVIQTAQFYLEPNKNQSVTLNGNDPEKKESENEKPQGTPLEKSEEETPKPFRVTPAAAKHFFQR